jgi:hypothetical protein
VVSKQRELKLPSRFCNDFNDHCLDLTRIKITYSADKSFSEDYSKAKMKVSKPPAIYKAALLANSLENPSDR